MNDSLPARSHGFRMSALDGVVLLLGTILTIWLRNEAFPLWWIVPMALGHFFLFCNVFLVWRRLELVWAAVFVILISGHLACGHTDWLSPLMMQMPVTLIVLWLQIRSPWYHGIFARQINPRLDDFLTGRINH
ncbi:MAG: hypothetical protein JNN17_11240 [Verrucomicrobiaceae bacterium]|nr:hypothetical protein [Verrucomicrobiaceae bacterium]